MMLLGLPVETWLLLAVATVPGFVLVVRAHRAQRRRRSGRSADPGGGGEGPAGPGLGADVRKARDERTSGPDRV